MKKEFVTYEQAFTLKELGFDEKCFCYFDNEKELRTCIGLNNWNNHEGFPLFVSALLKQQVFRFFREKFGWYANLSSWIHEPELGTYHEYEIYGTPNSAHGWTPFKTYEEAENACIDKLIEIAKQPYNGKNI